MRILVDKMPKQHKDCMFCLGYKESTCARYYVCSIDQNYRCVNVDECPFCKELVRGDDNDFSRVNSNDCATC